MTMTPEESNYLKAFQAANEVFQLARRIRDAFMPGDPNREVQNEVVEDRRRDLLAVRMTDPRPGADRLAELYEEMTGQAWSRSAGPRPVIDPARVSRGVAELRHHLEDLDARLG